MNPLPFPYENFREHKSHPNFSGPFSLLINQIDQKNPKNQKNLNLSHRSYSIGLPYLNIDF